MPRPYCWGSIGGSESAPVTRQLPLFPGICSCRVVADLWGLRTTRLNVLDLCCQSSRVSGRQSSIRIKSSWLFRHEAPGEFPRSSDDGLAQ